MKAERQQKEVTSRVIQSPKGGGCIVDNRCITANQANAIYSIQKKDDKSSSTNNIRTGIEFFSDNLLANRIKNNVTHLPIQRVAQEDLPVIYNLLPLEYQCHYKKEVTNFIGETSRTENRTLQQVWNVLEREAMQKGRTLHPKQTKEQVLNTLSNIEAVEYLKKNANKVVSEFKSDRLFLRGEGEPSPFIAGGKLVDLNVSFNGFSIGKGKLETILTKKNVLLFAAHGFTHSEGLSHVFDNTTKDYGFMSGRRASVERSTAPPESYKKMAEQLNADNVNFRVTGVPDLVVYPHYPDDAISKEGHFLMNVAGEMDIAILRDWEYDESTPIGRALSIAFVNTIPLPFILGSKPLNVYNKYLMQVCRADWSRDVPVSGGSIRVSPSLNPW